MAPISRQISRLQLVNLESEIAPFVEASGDLVLQMTKQISFKQNPQNHIISIDLGWSIFICMRIIVSVTGYDDACNTVWANYIGSVFWL